MGDYNQVGTGARFHDPDAPAPGGAREYTEKQRPETGIYTKLSSGDGSVRFRYEDAIAHEEDVVRRDPSDVIKVGGTYYVWYTKVTRQNENYPSGYNRSVWYASSPDGHAWKEEGVCIKPGPDDAWNGHGVFTPNILAHEGSTTSTTPLFPSRSPLRPAPTRRQRPLAWRSLIRRRAHGRSTGTTPF